MNSTGLLGSHAAEAGAGASAGAMQSATTTPRPRKVDWLIDVLSLGFVSATLVE
jgi:hypothetical protein